MSEQKSDWETALQQSLRRIDAVLSHPQGGRSAPVSPVRGQGSPGDAVGYALIGVGIALVMGAIFTGSWWMLGPAVAAFAIGGPRLGGGEGATRVSGHPSIAMGATLAADARVEPGAHVGMGATIGKGAIVRSGAIVRMGATLKEGAVVESGAVVSYGADIHKNAVVGARAVVGSGSTVKTGARVPEGMVLWPGTTFAGTAGPASSSREQAPALGATARPAAPLAGEPEGDAARIDAVCDRLQEELRAAPEDIRKLFGVSVDTVARLRRTSHDLLRREQSLRAEVHEEALTRLDAERATLSKRVEIEQDEVVRRSLEGAVAAIEDQQRQRRLLRRSADRLEAERTRLFWTLDGLATQLVRLRSAGAAIKAPQSAELESGIRKVREEMDAIAGALEEVAEQDRAAFQPISELPPEDPGGGAAGRRSKDRS